MRLFVVIGALTAALVLVADTGASMAQQLQTARTFRLGKGRVVRTFTLRSGPAGLVRFDLVVAPPPAR